MRDFHANQHAVQFSSREFNQEERKSSQCVNLVCEDVAKTRGNKKW